MTSTVVDATVLPPQPAAATNNDGEPFSVPSLRSTVEYAAAFDLEVWKKEERKRFKQHLEAELTQKRKELELEYAARDVARLQEIDTMRRDLQDMGKQLQTAGRVLQKKLTNLDRREEAFDARRLVLAQEAEGHLRSIEAKHRHLLEEAVERQEQLKAALRDKDVLLEQSQRRLTAVQSEYDQLQRFMTRLHTDRNQEAMIISDLRARCDSLADTTKQLESERSAKAEEAAALARDKAAIEGTCHLLEQKLREVAAAFRTLQEAYHRDREAHFTAEKERFAAAVRDQEMREWSASANHVHGGRYNVIATNRNHFAQQGAASSASQPETELTALKALVLDLKKEASAEEERARKKARKKAKKLAAQQAAEDRRHDDDHHTNRSHHQVPLRYAEVRESPSRTCATLGDVVFHQSPPMPQPITSHPHRHGRSTNDHQHQHPQNPRYDDDDDVKQQQQRRDALEATNVTVSTNSSSRSSSPTGGSMAAAVAHESTAPTSLGEALSEAALLDDVSVDGERMSFVSAPTPLEFDGHLTVDRLDGGGASKPLSVSSATVASSSGTATHHHHHGYPKTFQGGYAAAAAASLCISPALSVSQFSVSSWRPQPSSASAYDRDTLTDETLGGGGAIGGLPAANAAASSAASSSLQGSGSAAPLRPRVMRANDASTAVTKENTADSGGEHRHDSFAADRSIIASDSMVDVRSFVNRLVENRRRLLETGVYQENDDIIVEMDRKIRLYEHYLRAHFS